MYSENSFLVSCLSLWTFMQADKSLSITSRSWFVRLNEVASLNIHGLRCHWKECNFTCVEGKFLIDIVSLICSYWWLGSCLQNYLLAENDIRQHRTSKTFNLVMSRRCEAKEVSTKVAAGTLIYVIRRYSVKFILNWELTTWRYTFCIVVSTICFRQSQTLFKECSWLDSSFGWFL